MTPVPEPAAPGAPEMAVAVREARADELDRTVEIILAAYDQLWPDGLGYYADVIRSLPEVAISDDPLMVLVALAREAIVGSVAYLPDATSAWAQWSDAEAAGMRMLAVDPTVQGGGVGRALVEECLSRARAAGRGRFRLHTAPEMRVAHGLYERLGFERDEASDFRDPHDDMCIISYVLELG